MKRHSLNVIVVMTVIILIIFITILKLFCPTAHFFSFVRFCSQSIAMDAVTIAFGKHRERVRVRLKYALRINDITNDHQY